MTREYLQRPWFFLCIHLFAENVNTHIFGTLFWHHLYDFWLITIEIQNYGRIGFASSWLGCIITHCTHAGNSGYGCYNRKP